jgi:hypothetical protein
LLTLLAVEGTLVEINLTSNDRVLGVKDAEHPFLDYFSHDVPVALSTDDEGIARSNLTNEVSTRGAELQSRLPRAQNAGAQQLGRADEGHRLDGTLLERHVAQHIQQTLDMLVPSRVIAAGRQDNKREIRPGRLVAYPIKKRSRIGSEKSFFGNDPRAGSGL